VNAPSPEQWQTLLRELAQLQARLAEVLTENEALRAANAALGAENAELKARLDQNSQNSSKPPSTDPPWKPRPAKKPKSGKKQGGQAGHRGQTRALVPESELTGSHDYVPSHCRGCQAELPEAGGEEGLSPRRHQVWELPPARPEVYEHRCHSRRCPGCGTRTWAELPPEVPRSGQGPRLEAAIGYLTGALRLSRRRAAECLAELWGFPICAATVSNTEGRLVGALNPVYEEVMRALGRQGCLHADETTWWDGGKRYWLWTLTGSGLSGFRIEASRSRDAFTSFLAALGLNAAGPDPPILVSDRYAAYQHWHPGRHQYCLAHIIRALLGLAERSGPTPAAANWALDRLASLFRLWYRFRDGHLPRRQLRREAAALVSGVHSAFRMGAKAPEPKVSAWFEHLLAHWECLWLFLEHEGVEPTNNAAERALRGAVIWRKTSFGSQSERGQRYVERMMTVAETARRQGRSVFQFLVAVCQARLAGQPTPTLLSS
jgi:transposase